MSRSQPDFGSPAAGEERWVVAWRGSRRDHLDAAGRALDAHAIPMRIAADVSCGPGGARLLVPASRLAEAKGLVPRASLLSRVGGVLGWLLPFRWLPGRR